MARRNWLKAVAAASVGVAVGLVLSGCVATAGNIAVHTLVGAKAATAAANKPRVGDCWQATFKYADGYANWGDRPAVACDKPHQLYTYAVRNLKSLHHGALFDKKDIAHSAIVNDAYDTCVSASDADLPPEDDTVARLYIEDFLPEEKQWNAGARWVRCDIAVLAIGESVDHPEFATLPAWKTLSREMTHDASEFDYCVNGPSGIPLSDPHSSAAVYANCDDNPQWTLKDYIDIRSDPSDSYPSPADLAAQYESRCASQYATGAFVTYPVYPSKKDWADGDEELECWVTSRS